MIIRDYKDEDAEALWLLFFHTIRNINRSDYSELQVQAWAPTNFNKSIWRKKMDSIRPFIAEINGEIVGYADLQSSGLIDHFFCHHLFQRQGVGKALMNHIFNIGNQQGITRYYSDVSYTAKPFYQYHGFVVVTEQQIEVRGEVLTNFRMEKIVEKHGSESHV